MELLGKIRMACTAHDKEPAKGCVNCEFLRHVSDEMERMRKQRRELIIALLPFLGERRITIVGLV